jgi:hypothetical protein
LGVPPSVNNTVCHIAFNDTIIPYSGYKVSLTSTAGNAYPGFPQNWQLNGGLNGTVNVSQGAPLWNGTVVYPQPIVAQPLNHGPQSISGPLNMSGYNLVNVLEEGIGKVNPAFPVDVAGLINSDTGYLFAGVAPLAHCLVGNGTAYADASCPGNPPAINQQLVNVGLMNGNSGSGASMVGMSSDNTMLAENFSGERFQADFAPTGATNSDGSLTIQSFETQHNSYAQQGHWNCGTCTNSVSTPAYLVRALQFGGDPSWQIQAVMNTGTGITLECLGFNNAAFNGFVNPQSAGFIGTCFTSATGWVFYNNGAVTTLTACGGGGFAEVTFWYFGGHLRGSCMPIFGTTGVTTPILDNIVNLAGFDNFEITSTNVNDQFLMARYSVGGSTGQTNLVNMSNTDRGYNPSSIWTSSTAGLLWVLIPHNYRPGIANRWVIYNHGFNGVGWNITGGGNVGVANVANSLATAGYVVIGMNNTFENCYGNPQCVADTAAVIHEVTSLLSLAPQPYIFADSIGGLTMLNATMRGIVKPRAMVGIDINSSLAYADSIGPGIIDAAYGVPYATTSIGYDPMLATGQFLTNLLVPTMLWSSPGDTTNLQSQNALAYAAFINGVLPRTVQLQTHVGGHEDLSGFNGPAVVNFFNSR